MPSTGVPDPDELRRQLIALVRQKKKRKLGWTKDRPTDWRPHEVHDEWGALNDTRAWNCVLEWLESDRPIETKEMPLPSGKVVWIHVLVEPLQDQMIYVKLELLPSGEVLGWSFHHSERTSKEADKTK